MDIKWFDVLKQNQKKRVHEELENAYDFDPKDPLFGLNKSEFSGPVMSRRAVLRLMAAAGVLSAWHFLPGTGISKARAASGGTLNAGWSGVGGVCWASRRV